MLNDTLYHIFQSYHNSSTIPLHWFFVDHTIYRKVAAVLVKFRRCFESLLSFPHCDVDRDHELSRSTSFFLIRYIYLRSVFLKIWNFIKILLIRLCAIIDICVTPFLGIDASVRHSIGWVVSPKEQFARCVRQRNAAAENFKVNNVCWSLQNVNNQYFKSMIP